jgi:hypothetical protein
VINSIVLQDCCEVYQFVTPVVRTIDHSNASEIHDRWTGVLESWANTILTETECRTGTTNNINLSVNLDIITMMDGWQID